MSGVLWIFVLTVRFLAHSPVLDEKRWFFFFFFFLSFYAKGFIFTGFSLCMHYLLILSQLQYIGNQAFNASTLSKLAMYVE